MKKFLFPLLAIAAFTVGTAAAQTTAPANAETMNMPAREGRMQGNPDEMAKRQGERLSKELALTPDQTTKVQQILLARGQEMQAMRGQARDASNRGQMRDQMQASRAKYDAQFKEVLSPDQYTKYTAMQADRMERGGMRGGGMRDGDGTDVKKMKAKTTDGDKVKVKADN
ncbi:MAG: DUF4890 domain-containing protein [Bacteroidota bacterium]|nr:DUF4890 domain-containing protein [Bacteroidota bacterium]